MSESSGRSLSVGGVIQTVLAVCGRNALAFAPFVLVLSVLPSILFGLVRMASIEGGGAGEVGFAENFVTFVLGLPLTIALTEGALADLRGGRAEFRRMISAASTHLMMVLWISIVTSVGIFLACLALIVPGLIVAAMWTVAIPERISEGGGLNAVLAKSSELSKGSRPRIIALLLLLITFYLGFYLAPYLAIEMLAPDLLYGAWGWTITLVLEPIVFALYSIALSVGAAVIYAELKRLKEGVFGDQLARVFD